MSASQPTPPSQPLATASAPARPPRLRQAGKGALSLLLWVVVLALAAGGGYYWYTMRGAADAAGGADKGAADNKDGAAKGAGKGGAPGKGGRFARDGAMPVIAATIRNETINVRLTALGTVTPRNNVVVRSRVDGPLLRLHFKEGDIVKAGQLLAEIDPLQLQAALTQSAGQLARDQALLQNAQIDLKRYQDLMATDSIAKQQVDTQASTVRQYEGVVATDRGQLEAARLQLSYARILAPISGQIGLRLVDPGNMVKAGDANGLVTITEMDPINVISAVPEASVAALRARIRDGGEVPVEAWDSGMKNLLARGKLVSTDNQIDVTTGTLKLKAEFVNTSGILFPNQFVNVRILIGQEPNAVVIRQAAIQRGAQGIYTYVIKDDSSVTVRVITLGTVDGERVAVTSGLAPGERVVMDGADKLREGAKVEVIDASVAAAATAPNPDAGRKGGRRGKGGEGGTGAPGGAASGGAAVTAPAGAGGERRAKGGDGAPGAQGGEGAPGTGGAPGAQGPRPEKGSPEWEERRKRRAEREAAAAAGGAPAPAPAPAK